MTEDALKAAHREIQKDLTHAIQQRDYWTVEAARLQQLSDGLETSIAKKSGNKAKPLSSIVPIGFTDLIHSIVRSSGLEMSATEVREALKTSGYDFSEYANPLGFIHQTLKRLAKDGRIADIGNGTYRAAETEWKRMREFGTPQRATTLGELLKIDGKK